MDRTCKHKFRPGCEDLEGRQLLSTGASQHGSRLKLKPTRCTQHRFGSEPPGMQGSNYFIHEAAGDFVVRQKSGVPGFLY